MDPGATEEEESEDGGIRGQDRRHRNHSREHAMPGMPWHASSQRKPALQTGGTKHRRSLQPFGFGSGQNFSRQLQLTDREHLIADRILKEIRDRTRIFSTKSAWAISISGQRQTLSGGEAQRIRLATQIGSSLVGVIYVLDEPSIGLHQRDNNKLIATLTSFVI